MLGKRASTWAFDTTETPALYFGVCIGLLALTSAKAVQQSFLIYSRTNSLKNVYAWMSVIHLQGKNQYRAASREFREN